MLLKSRSAISREREIKQSHAPVAGNKLYKHRVSSKKYHSPKPWSTECQMPALRVPAYPVPEDSRFSARIKSPARYQAEASCVWDGQVTVACVLRLSREFGPGEVNRLNRAVKRNLARPFRFVCLTDCDEGRFDSGIETVRLKHPEWVTKHSKIELFRPDLLADWGRTIYIDLDTVICGSLDDIATYDGSFAMLRDFYHSAMNGSGFMCWGGSGELAEIYHDFCSTSEDVRSTKYKIGGGLGDQLFIRHHTPIAPHQIQDCFPGQIGSYKVHFRNRPEPKHKPRVVCFHGRPKPQEIGDGWIRQHYD